MGGKRKPKFHKGQVVRLQDDYISSFGWSIKSGTICEIVGRGRTWDSQISFSIDSLQAPFNVWVSDEQLRPLTKWERE